MFRLVSGVVNMVGRSRRHVIRGVGDCGHVRRQVGWHSGGPACIARAGIVGQAGRCVGLRCSGPGCCSIPHGGVTGGSIRGADVAGLGGTHIQARC